MMISRKGMVTVVLMIIFLLLPVSVCGHPPTGISMTYDKVSGVLTVTVNHTSEDLTLHFIERIDITVNDVFQDIVPWDMDESEVDLIATYNISLNDGDKVVAEAFCSEYGSMVSSLVVGDSGKEPSTPGFELLMFLGAVMLFFVIRKRRVSNT